MYEVVVEDWFSAGHFLKLTDGSLEPRHGHDWRVEVTVHAEKLDSMGVVVDFEWLKPALKQVLAEFHETSINEHPAFKGGKQNSSTELIAKTIYDKLNSKMSQPDARLVQVTVYETPDARASYRS